jgi:hypothetical protein
MLQMMWTIHRCSMGSSWSLWVWSISCRKSWWFCKTAEIVKWASSILFCENTSVRGPLAKNRKVGRLALWILFFRITVFNGTSAGNRKVEQVSSIKILELKKINFKHTPLYDFPRSYH